jgi:hypothetical protein
MVMNRVSAVAWLLPLALSACVTGAPWPAGEARFPEPSGLVASRMHPGVFWTLCDSGGPAAIFAIDAQGMRLGEFSVEDAVNRDWEDITTDGLGNLYLADTGNNARKRTDLVVYRVREPPVLVAHGRVTVDRRFRFRYPERPDGELRRFDCESLFHARGALYLLTKVRPGRSTSLYRFPYPRGSTRATLVTVGSRRIEAADTAFGAGATAADATPDGHLLAVLTYSSVLIFERPADSDNWLSRPIGRIRLDPRWTEQCEGLAWSGNDLLIINEEGETFRIEYPPATSGVTPR